MKHKASTQASTYESSVSEENELEVSRALQENSKKNYLKKPPCSPIKGFQRERIAYGSPSPTKKRTDFNKENFKFSNTLNDENPASNQLSLFSVYRSPQTPDPSTKASNLLKNLSGIQRNSKSSLKVLKKSSNASFDFKRASRDRYQNPSKHSSLSHPTPDLYTTPNTTKGPLKLYTPILIEKKRREPKVNYCKRISLFECNKSIAENVQNSGPECFNSFKEQLSRNEDSTSIGEITPNRNEDSLKKEFPDESFSSPVRTIKVQASPDKSVHTPDATGRKINFKQSKACKKAVIDFSTPESHFFSLSSSSDHEAISDVSFSEDVPPSFGDISSMNAKTGFFNAVDKEMQTESQYQDLIEILKDPGIVSGLKAIGKFSEFLKIIIK
jgi:hypothetical protein